MLALALLPLCMSQLLPPAEQRVVPSRAPAHTPAAREREGLVHGFCHPVGPLPILHCEPQAHCFALGPLSNATRGVFRSFKREGWSSKTRAGFRSLEEVHRHLVVNAEQHPASPLAGPYVGQPSARSSEHRLRKSALFSAESGPASLPFLYVRSVSPYDAYEEYGHLFKGGALALDAQGRIYPMNYNHTQCSPLSGHSSMLRHSSVLTIGLSATCELQLARILYSSGSTTQSV